MKLLFTIFLFSANNAIAASTGFGIQFMDCTPPASFFEIQDITRVLGSDSTTYGLNFIFENPGNYDLNVAASSSDELVAVVSVQKSGLDENVGYDMNVRYNGIGTTYITVTVATSCGVSISQTFTVTVVQPKLTFTPAVGLLDDLILTYEGSSQIMGIEHAYFSPDGTKIFRTGATSMAYEQELNVPHDITSGATTSPELFKGSGTEFKFRPNTTAYYASSRGITFSKDGKKIFGQTAATTNIFIQASLETAFDLRSEHTVDSEFVPGVEGHLQNMHFSEDGLSLFYYDFSLLKVQELELAAPFDVSGGFTDGASFGVDSLATTWSYDFNRDGTVVQLVDAEKFKISYYSLNAPFDLSEAPVYLGEYVLDSTGLGSPGYSGKVLDNIYWSKDQKKLYVETFEYGSSTLDMLHQYGVSGGAAVFKETESNAGNVEGEMLVTSNGSRFVNAGGTLTAGSHFTIDNLPAGLDPVATVSADGYQLSLKFTGAALAHDVLDNIGDLTISFTDAAFESDNASAFANAIVASTGFGIEFIASPKPEITKILADTTVYLTANLQYKLSDYFSASEALTFTATSGNNAVATPAISADALTIGLTSSGSAELVVTATGTSGGEVAQSFSITVEKSYLTFGADDGSGALAGGFIESETNDGAVEGSIVATVYGNLFKNEGGFLQEGTDFEIDNLPAGLTPVLGVNAPGDQATLTLTGQADAHESSGNVENLVITFSDGAFQFGTMADFVNASGVGTGFGIEFDDRPIPQISREIPDTTVYLTANLQYNLTNYFSSPEALVFATTSGNNAVATTAISAGVLTIGLESAGGTEIVVTATGTSGGEATQSFNITVERPYLTFGAVDGSGALVGGFIEPEANDGSVDGSLVATVRGSLFINAGGTLKNSAHYTISNLPKGLTPEMSVNATGDQVTLTLTGRAADHKVKDEVADLHLTFKDAAFTTGGASLITNATDASTGFGIAFIESVAPVGDVDDVIIALPDDGDGVITISLSEVFPDASRLTYSVHSSNRGVATARMEGTEIIIKPVGAGVTTITVVATKTSAHGRTQSETVEFDVEVAEGVLATESLEPPMRPVIFPNPTTEAFTIDFGREHKNVTMEISNAAGQVISSKFYEAARQVESSISLEAGVYILNLKSDQMARLNYRIIKQ